MNHLFRVLPEARRRLWQSGSDHRSKFPAHFQQQQRNMSRPSVLTGLTEREAITDAVYRVLSAFDHHDTGLLESAFDGEDVSLVFNGNETKGLSNIRAKLFDKVGPMATSHVLSNVRVDVKDGARTASLNALAVVQHCPPGTHMEPAGPNYMGASEYFVDVVKSEGEEGLWKIKKWSMTILWARGDPSVLARLA